MKRTLEPELMDGTEQALAYAQADFLEPNSRFIALLAEHWPGHRQALAAGATAIDLGCGPADIVLRLLRAYPRATCDAVDGSAAMLAHAQAILACCPDCLARTRLIQACLPCAADAGLRDDYDLILSNSLLHHLHRPEILWHSLRELARPGAFVLVMDLMRPPEPSWVEALVRTYAGNEPEVLQRDFRHSLHAAFEPAEVQAQLVTAGLDGSLSVRVLGDRHLAVWGTLP